ncbi:hypothetical protein HanIR_Chr02g0090711 [Helianthus annuus]|nr:hypothetical protein HanIR_Chr02g0090711 [Helianthus annuus]
MIPIESLTTPFREDKSRRELEEDVTEGVKVESSRELEEDVPIHWREFQPQDLYTVSLF